MTTATLTAHVLAALLRSRDERVQADVVPAWRYGTCDVCGDLECAGNVRIRWTSARDGGEHEAAMNREHADGWLTGLGVPDAGADAYYYDSAILIEIGEPA